MKKIIIALAALATIAACNKAEVVEAPKGDAIAFGDAFVDNATKAIYKTPADVQGFSVWGNVKGTNETPLALYPEAGAVVTRNGAALGAAWTCSVARYWTPSASYNFTAIANGTVKETDLNNGIPTKISYSVNELEPADLIYGARTATTDESAAPITGVNDAKVVTFTMEHLLSRLQVSFQNTLSDGYIYNISNVKVSTWKDGVYTISTEAWAKEGTNSVNLVYGDVAGLAPTTATVATGDHLIIPGSDIIISFDYTLNLNGTPIYSKSVINYSVSLSSVKGNSYTINVQLKAGNEIQFSVAETSGLGAWVNVGSSDVEVQ